MGLSHQDSLIHHNQEEANGIEHAMRNNSWAIMFIKMSACIFVATPDINY